MEKIINLFLLIFLTFSVTVAQEDENVLGELQKEFKTINDFRANFTQNSSFSNQTKSSTLKGKLSYKKDNKFRIELNNSILVSDGKELWNFNKKENKVYINKLENEYSFFSLKNIILDYPQKSFVRYLGEENLNGKTFKIIQITPKEGELNFETIKLWYNKQVFIGKVEIIDSGGVKHQFELSGIKVNQKIPDSLFSFVPSEGSEVIDLR